LAVRLPSTEIAGHGLAAGQAFDLLILV